MDKYDIAVRLEYVMEMNRIDKSYKELHSTGNKMAKYGTAAFLGGGSGVLATYLFRHFTDRCKKQCENNKLTYDNVCFNMCYIKASEKAISSVEKDIKSAKKIEDSKSKNRRLKKLNKELGFFKMKRERYIMKLKKAKQKKAAKGK